MSNFRLSGQCYMYYYGGPQSEKLGNFSVAWYNYNPLHGTVS